MVHDDGALMAARGSAYTAATPVPLQSQLAKPAEVAGIVLPEGVAGCTVAVGADFLSTAPAIQRSLQSPPHRPPFVRLNPELVYGWARLYAVWTETAVARGPMLRSSYPEQAKAQGASAHAGVDWPRV